MNTSRIKLFIGDFFINIGAWLSCKSGAGSKLCGLLFYIYKSILYLCGLKFLPIISTKEFSEINDECQRYLIKYNRRGISVTSSIPFANSNIVLKKELSDLYLTKFNNILISGGSDFIVDNSCKWIINDFCINKSNNIFIYDSLLYREKNNYGILRSVINKEPSELHSGILLGGKFSHNYYHCFYENLNRALLIDDGIIPIDVPILVDQVVMTVPSLLKLVHCFSSNSTRQILPIEINKLYKVRTLYYIDHFHFIIPHHKKLTELVSDKTFYDSELISLQRKHLLKMRKEGSSPTHVFITRSNAASRHYNEEEVYQILKVWGFQKIAPETMTFEEQINLFYNAKYIIGGSGAAFSNIIFCQPGCRILCFRPIQTKEGTPLFKTIAWINNTEFWHYPADKVVDKTIHSNYYISPVKLKDVLINLWGFS